MKWHGKPFWHLDRRSEELRDTPLWLLELISEDEIHDCMLIDNPNLRWNAPFTKPEEYVISGPYWGNELKRIALDVYGEIICLGGIPDLFLIHCHAVSSQIQLFRHWLYFCRKLGVNPNVRRMKNDDSGERHK